MPPTGIDLGHASSQNLPVSLIMTAKGQSASGDAFAAPFGDGCLVTWEILPGALSRSGLRVQALFTVWCTAPQGIQGTMLMMAVMVVAARAMPFRDSLCRVKWPGLLQSTAFGP
jgi:hypothetical protein